MAQKEHLEEKSKLEAELRSALNDKGIWDSAEQLTHIPPPAINLPKLCEEEERIEAVETNKIVEALMQHATVVDNEAYIAKNLAGTSKRRLRITALAMKAGTRILSKKAQHPQAFNEARMEALRAKAKRLEEEARKKNAKIAELQQQYEELHNFKATLVTGMSPKIFERAFSRSPRERRDPPPPSTSVATRGASMEVDVGAINT